MAPSCKKIILTTDQDLIKDGVQAIDDEFLEWFVKNPSCEFVEVDKEEDELVSPKNPKIRFNYLQDPPSFISAESLNNMILTYKYKIIIPQEKPKQEHNKYLSCCRSKEECHCKEEPKQENDYTALLQPVGTKKETLEELKKWKEEALIAHEINQKVIEKLMAERKLMYSEEEVIELLKTFDKNFNSGIVERNKGINEWFEQYKNK
jgi:hypothetical protein